MNLGASKPDNSSILYEEGVAGKYTGEIKNENNRLYGLDIFRFFLAVEILMFHSNGHLGCSYGGFLDLFLRAGAVTMTAFFILSGYVNQYSFGRCDFSNWSEIKKFYLKRLIGILPSYYLVVIIFDCLISNVPMQNRLILVPTESMCLQTIFTSLFSIGHNGGTWFISCIVICYFVFPFLNIIVKQMSNKEKLVCFFVLTAVLYYCPIIVLRFNLSSIYTNPFIRMIEYSIGIILASLVKNQIASKDRKQFFIMYSGLCIVSIGLLLLYMKWHGVIYDYMIYSIFFLPIWIILILLLKKIKIKNDVYKKIISFASAITYDMFLVQLFVWSIVKYIVRFYKINNIQMIALTFFICFSLAISLHLLYEKPIRKLLLNRVFVRNTR